MDTNERDTKPAKPNDAEFLVKPSQEKNVPNKIKEALILPTCMNLNPRSIYNKVTEFITLIKEEQVQCIFLSESWERPDFDLSQLISIEDYKVISNPHQRQGVGGRPALIVDTKSYHVKNLTNTLITIPWGCEAVLALLTPKNVTSASKVQRIALCSLYCKPNSRTKNRLLNHISQTYSVLSAKYQTGLHFLIACDTNDLKLDSILLLNPRMQQLVKGITRLDPPKMLDPIISTLGSFYPQPEILPPLDADPDINGKTADHLIPVMRPINSINNRCSRTYQNITVRPIHQSGMKLLTNWFENQDWSENLSVKSVDSKAELLLYQVTMALNEYLPQKNHQGCQ